MALPQLSGCPVYQFKPRITFADGTQPAETYGVSIPPGLAPSNVPAPNFIPPTNMTSKLHDVSGHGDRLKIVHGLTVPEFAVTFPNMAQQWRRIGTGAFPSWQFQGGDVFLDVTLTVYILEGDRPQPNGEASRKIYAILMSHELLHVLDEIDIVSRWMPPKVYGDDKVLKYLTNAQPVDDSMFRTWFQGSGFTNWLRDGYWSAERERRKQLRDTAQEYTTQGDRIATLRAEIANRPSH
jgi:hypothetical protein